MMTLEGTIVGGHVRLDMPSSLPDGTRVRLVTNEDDLDDLPPPLPTETYEQHMAQLRESVAESKSGQTRPAREVLKELAIQHGLRLLPGE
jgi:hypothetical protein